MIIGTDPSGKVLMSSDGALEHMPTELNGTAITAFVLNADQEEAFKALPADRAGTMFDGAHFTAIQHSAHELTLAQIARTEASQPVTQRALREMILVIGEAFPAAKQSVFYQRAAAQELAVVALRSQLT